MEVKFFKHSGGNDLLKLTFYTPLQGANSSIIRYVYIPERIKEQTVDADNNPVTTMEAPTISIEYNVVSEQTMAVPLKYHKRVKQNKEVEIFQIEESRVVMQQTYSIVSKPDEIAALLVYLDEHCIN